MNDKNIWFPLREIIRFSRGARETFIIDRSKSVQVSIHYGYFNENTVGPKETSATFEKSYRRCGNKSWDLIILGREIDISHKRLVFAQRRYIVQRLPKVVKLLKITRWLSMIIIIEKNATNIPLKINIPYTNVLTLCRQRSKKNNNFPWRNLHLQSNSYYHDLFLNKLGKDLKLLFDERKIFI